MKNILSADRRPLIATFLVCLVLYGAAAFYLRDFNFASLRVFFNFFSDNGFLGVIAIGLTLVILTGGIDLSVGTMAGCASIMVAVLITEKGIHPLLAFAIVGLFGAVVGLTQGFLIARFQLAPFLVTLGGLFFCRGAGLLVSDASVSIKHPLVQSLGSPAFTIAKSPVQWTAIIFLVLAIVMGLVLRQTRFGRTLYAVGGSAQSAQLMGLPVKHSLMLAYTLSGLFAAFGGILFATFTGSGNALAGQGLELDAIAAVVIGGTLLTGGAGSMLGTVLGILTVGILQTAISFSNVNSWWTKIAVGALTLIFVLFQRGLSGKANS